MAKEEIYALVKELEDLCLWSCRKIWHHPEVGGTEKDSSEHYRKMLGDEGFTIKNESRYPYCFCAEYGSGSPVIAILGEYDALPGLSQKPVSHKEAEEEGAAGHGCGHNLLGSAAAAGAIAIKRFLEKAKISGTVRFYGCPEEEILCGKVKMIYYKMFDGCDIAISWHPMSANVVYDSGYLANASAHFAFNGRASHAGFAPHLGRSALDAVELMNVGVNYMREHVNSAARIHYSTCGDRFAPNIVPPHASSWYFVRAPYITEVKEILDWIGRIAQGAALMTETTAEMKIDYGCCEMLENHAYADLAYANMLEAGVPKYTDEEKQFARELLETVAPADLKRAYKSFNMEAPLVDEVTVRDQYLKTPLTASTDSGDVSQMMPMCMFSVTCWPIATAPHTWQAAASAGTSIGEKGALAAAKILAGIAYDLYTQPETLAAIKAEFEAKKAQYAPMYEE